MHDFIPRKNRNILIVIVVLNLISGVLVYNNDLMLVLYGLTFILFGFFIFEPKFNGLNEIYEATGYGGFLGVFSGVLTMIVAMFLRPTDVVWYYALIATVFSFFLIGGILSLIGVVIKYIVEKIK